MDQVLPALAGEQGGVPLPRNWLHPELRDDKTQIFRDFESGIAQGEPGDQLVKDSLLLYMDELAEIAKARVYGMYIDSDSTLYMVGRPPDQPYHYYLRKCRAFGLDGMCWDGWERIDLDITDDHVMPFVMEGSLHIAWPAIVKKSKPDPADPGNVENQIWYWELQLNWARRAGKGWTKKKLSSGIMPLPSWPVIKCQNRDNEAAKELTFRLKYDPDRSEDVLFCVYNNIFVRFDPSKVDGPLSENKPGLHVSAEDDYLYTWDFIDDDGHVTSTLYGWDALYHMIALGVLGNYYDIHATTCDVRLFNQYNDRYNKKTWYGPATKTMIWVTYSCVDRWEDLDKEDGCYMFLQNAGHATVNSTGDPVFHTSIDWNELYNHDNKQCFLAKVEVSIGDIPGKRVIGTYKISRPADGSDPVVVLTNYSLSVIADVIDYNDTLDPVGQFRLSPTGDVRIERQDETTSQPVDIGVIHADGYLVNYAGPDLELDIDNDPAAKFTVKDIVDSTEPFFVIPAAKGTGITPATDVWFFDDALTHAYLRGVKRPDGTIRRIGVYDNLPLTAALRSTAYKNFDGKDGFYSISSQDGLKKRYADLDSLTGVSTDWGWVAKTSPGRITDPFDLRAPAANYNWEIYYHVLMRAAEYLIRQQRFDDARKWLHFLFDPTRFDRSVHTQHPATQSWQFVPFRQNTDGYTLQSLFETLAKHAADPANPGLDATALASIRQQIAQWELNPFDPFAVARLRYDAFQWRTLFTYLDYLIDCGDHLFRQDTREAINEAILMYMLAVRLLGPRPRSIRPQLQPRALSYRELSGRWDEFGNAWSAFFDNPLVYAMCELMYGGKPPLNMDVGHTTQVPLLTSVGLLYFCVPHNEKLLGYWDKVEDRLAKIHACKNFDGATRELSLFAPKIDPDLLVRATAAGLDLGTVLADLYTPPIPYRWHVIHQKATTSSVRK